MSGPPPEQVPRNVKDIRGGIDFDMISAEFSDVEDAKQPVEGADTWMG
jgi:hypothetical protein